MSNNHLIERLLEDWNVTDYDIVDGKVNVVGNVRIPVTYHTIPFKFGTVDGDFDCGHFSTYHANTLGELATQITPARLNSLLNSPDHVTGHFDCEGTNITSLQYGPVYVEGNMLVSKTQITSLKHAPTYVGGSLVCARTNIKKLSNVQYHITDSTIGKLIISADCTHLLGLSFVQGVNYVDRIAHKYSLTGGPYHINLVVNHDPFLWQEELIKMGLIEQAQL